MVLHASYINYIRMIIKEIWTMSSKDVMQFNAIWDYAMSDNLPFFS